MRLRRHRKRRRCPHGREPWTARVKTVLADRDAREVKDPVAGVVQAKVAVFAATALVAAGVHALAEDYAQAAGGRAAAAAATVVAMGPVGVRVAAVAVRIRAPRILPDEARHGWSVVGGQWSVVGGR